ncbi:TnsA endonuclease N-terminal domain-containing protein [Undibacterium terreum]|uniref:TnsA endonuclease N-terminal domain-containing protein n=1 Tax=Undibacterium terreum TaxID=1224302 RepID=A0A916XMA7_9BURK|nr:TnsA endonuclease N-terminal domain-containing protein [Undibacterium terreum]GGC83595.1 hypothetical protein GCM10011396_33750 [Undibacterium terreum]
MKPKRKVVTRSPHRTVGLVACTWLQPEPVEYESQLERRFVQRMLLTPGVSRIVDQPFKIAYGDNCEKSYTPDFLITLSSGQKFVVEVKPEKFVAKFADMFDQIIPILREKDLPFLVVTDQMIDVGDLPETIELLLRYARSSVSSEIFDRVKKSFNTSEPQSISQLVRSAEVNLAVVFHFLGRRLLTFLNDISLSPDTLINPYFLKEDHENVCIPSWLNAAAWNPDARIHQATGAESSAVRRYDHAPKLHMAHR